MLGSGEIVLYLCRRRMLRDSVMFSYKQHSFQTFLVPSPENKNHRPQKGFFLMKYKSQGLLPQLYAATKRDSCNYKRPIFSSKRRGGGGGGSTRELIPHISSCPKGIFSGEVKR